METKIFTKDTLKEFIDSEYFHELHNIPINIQRAISQINNPRADEDDVLLVAQFDELQTVGYLGILPDYIFHGGVREKVGWLTCFWVNEQYKSQGIAANLFRRVIKAWNQKILITNMVPESEAMYQKTKMFQPTKYKVGFRGYLRFNLSEILPPKKIFFLKTAGFLRLIDKALNLFANRRFLFYNWKDVRLKYEYHLDFNFLPEKLIESSFSDNFIRRGKNELNWIVKYPWIIEGGSEDENSKRYYFSSINNRFFYQIISFKDKGKITAVLLIVIRENNLTIPYFYHNTENITDDIAIFLIKKMVDLRLNMITTFNRPLEKALRKQRKYFIYSKSIKKSYIISKYIENLHELNFQDGDGDCAFY